MIYLFFNIAFSTGVFRISWFFLFAVIKFTFLGNISLFIMNPASPTKLYGSVVLMFLIEGKMDRESCGSVLIVFLSLIILL